MIFIQKDNTFINLALVKKFELNKEKIIFYFDLERDDYTTLKFESEEKAEKYLNTTILPMFMRALPKG